MKYIIGVLIIIFCINSFAEPEIIVRKESFVESSKITFGDIAEFKNIKPDQSEKIKSIVIGNSPQAGESRTFTGFGLSEILRYSLATSSGIKIKIPNEVTVRPEKFILDKKVLETKLSAWISQECEPCQVKFLNLKVPNFENISGSAQWDIVKLGRAPRGNFNVAVVVQDPKIGERKFWATGEARIFKDVPVVKKLVSSMGRIQKDDYKIENRDITFINDVVPTELEIQGSELSRILGANEIIWKSNLKRKMVIQRGQPVNIVMKNESWNVNVKGLAQGFGYVGDLVKVLNPNTNKVLVGVILDEGNVEVRQ